MDSRKTLFTLLAGAAITTVIGILLTPYKDSSKRKKIGEKTRDYTDSVGEIVKDSVANVKNRFQKMG